MADIRRQPGGAPIDLIYFGGGTPSLLTPQEVGTIVTAVRDAFALGADAEITLEANPESVTPESTEGYLAAGINRVSLGVQSFRDDELMRLGRLHSSARAVAAVRELRTAGLANISLDLMLWLPEQTREHLAE